MLLHLVVTTPIHLYLLQLMQSENRTQQLQAGQVQVHVQMYSLQLIHLELLLLMLLLLVTSQVVFGTNQLMLAH